MDWEEREEKKIKKFAYERFPAFVSILRQSLGATGGFDCMFSFINLYVCAILYYFNAVFLSFLFVLEVAIFFWLVEKYAYH